MLKPLSVLLGFVFIAYSCSAPDQGEAARDVDLRPGLEGDTAPDAALPVDTAADKVYDNEAGTLPAAPH